MVRNSIFQKTLHLVQSLTLGGLLVTSVALIGTCIASAIGLIPWLHAPMTFGGTVIENAGMYGQIFVAVLVASLLFFVPLNKRVMQLERTHRDFQISMDDVAQAYYLCHTADREGAFSLSAEFDAVRERLTFMRKHPELKTLEPALMEVAAQMSQQSRELADIYSKEKVERAREFLQQRQGEVMSLKEEIAQAKTACAEIKQWVTSVDKEDKINDENMQKLDADLQEVLKPLGYDIARAAKAAGQKVVPMVTGAWPEHVRMQRMD